MPRKRKFIVSVTTSADGFIARPDDSFDFLDRPRPKGNYGMNAFLDSVDTVLWGRRTYDLSVKFGRSEGFAGKKNYVFSRTSLEAANPNVVIVNQNITEFANKLRDEKGKHIWLMGGAGLVASFLDCEQVDEFIIKLVPRMIGEGIPLVAPRHRNLALKLLKSKAFPDGVVSLHYSVRYGP
jgi:dihydrofolate reductase